MFKKLLAIITIAGISFPIVAQNIEGLNARIDAMGGSGVGDDIGWTVGQPRALCGYPDQIQGSAIIKNIMDKGQTFGRIIVIKSLGDYVFLGLTMNNDRMLLSRFYNTSALFLNAFGDLEIGNINENFQTMPHINLCFKITDDYSVGAGFIMERTSFKTSILDSLNFKDSTNEKSITHIGGIVDAKITLGSVAIVPSIKFGFPRIKGIEENKDTSNLSKYEWKSEKGYFLKGGSLVCTEIGNTFWICGAWFKKEAYQFKKNDSLGYEYDNKVINWFIGFNPVFSDKFYLAFEYDGGVEIKEKTASDIVILEWDSLCNDTTGNYWYHDFRLGMERSIGNVWFFDEIIPRAGLAYKISRTTRGIINSVSDGKFTQKEVKTTKTNIDPLSPTAEGLKVTAGIGLKKGRATVDISADLLRWGEGSGVISGPSASMATLTIDISRKKNRQKDKLSKAKPLKTDSLETEPSETESFETEPLESEHFIEEYSTRLIKKETEIVKECYY